jgi:serine protease AprX
MAARYGPGVYSGLGRRTGDKAMMRRGLALLVLAAGLIGASGATVPLAATYVVTFDAPPTAAQIDSVAAIASGVHAYRHLPAAVAVIPPGLAGLLRNLPGVRGVYPDRALEYTLDNSTDTLRADGAWADGYSGAGIGIAVIDAGVDGTHPDLCAAAEYCSGTPIKTVQNVKFIGDQAKLDPVVVLENQISTDSSSGHGTHVAGIAAGFGVASETPGKYRGVAHGARLIGLGCGEIASVTTVLAAFDWVLANHANPLYNIKVVNNSWGPGAGAQYDAEEPVQRGIDAMHDAGITVVFGAGNDGPRTGTINVFSANPRAISAAAGTKAGHIALFSSRGVPGSSLLRPTVTAPGQFIASVRARTGFYAWVADATGPDPLDPILPPDDLSYAYASGTSMSSPHVAGMAALVQEAALGNLGRYLTPAEVRNVLQNTAVSRDPARGVGGLPSYQGYTMGAGYADAQAAVRAAAAGVGLQAHDDGVVEDVRAFTGAVLPDASFEVSYNVLPGAIALDVMIDWGAPNASLQDLDIDLYRPDGTLHFSTAAGLSLLFPQAAPNNYNSTVTGQPNERITVAAPAAGTWRAVIKGAVSAGETVFGLWSVVYPDGTVLPPPQTATLLTVAAPALPGVAGELAALTATLRDAAGQPVANAPVSWGSSGVGAIVTSEPFTDERGMALATARSDVPGTQVATAFSGAATGSASLTWLAVTLPPLSQSSAGKASGGGFVNDPNKRHFAFYAEYTSAASAPGGEVAFDDKSGTRVASAGVESIVINGNRATVKGPATVNGNTGYRFELTAIDNGEPGSADSVNLLVTQPLNPLFRYESGGVLAGGNVKVQTY